MNGKLEEVLNLRLLCDCLTRIQHETEHTSVLWLTWEEKRIPLMLLLFWLSRESALWVEELQVKDEEELRWQ
ncbi:hypothetical protein [Hominibacterium faecale]|uniref:hypothetical protein n=1 Tax=Hominibacterium faecale TaxID=2839743 RepID=UPI001D0FEB9A|nr:hypothetical protein [Hominibacterium faecale]MCC2865478.1 hypothetical protein [Anaerovorax odorimutans]